MLRIWEFKEIMTIDDGVKQKNKETAAAVEAQQWSVIPESPGLSGIHQHKERSQES